MVVVVTEENAYIYYNIMIILSRTPDQLKRLCRAYIYIYNTQTEHTSRTDYVYACTGYDVKGLDQMNGVDLGPPSGTGRVRGLSAILPRNSRIETRVKTTHGIYGTAEQVDFGTRMAPSRLRPCTMIPLGIPQTRASLIAGRLC